MGPLATDLCILACCFQSSGARGKAMIVQEPPKASPTPHSLLQTPRPLLGRTSVLFAQHQPKGRAGLGLHPASAI